MNAVQSLLLQLRLVLDLRLVSVCTKHTLESQEDVSGW